MRTNAADAQHVLRVNSVAEDVTTLGPSPAAVIWTQGCPIACPGCMSRDTWNPSGGVQATVCDMAAWLAGTRSRNLTLSGGEPSEQAEALNVLLDLLEPSWIVTLYSGRNLDELRGDSTAAVTALLSRVDLVIAGPYVRERHAVLRWRGSDNQIIHDMSGRADLSGDDTTAGLSFRLRRRAVELIGVPPQPGLVETFRTAAAAHGAPLSRNPEQPTFPFPVMEA